MLSIADCLLLFRCSLTAIRRSRSRRLSNKAHPMQELIDDHSVNMKRPRPITNPEYYHRLSDADIDFAFVEGTCNGRI